MKLLRRFKSLLSRRAIAPALGVAFLAVQTASANPFASCLTVTNGTVQFYLNEGGGTVTVTYEDGSTNTIFNGASAVSAGVQSFGLTNNSIVHTSYAITCHKNGAGAPYQISTDTNMYDIWVGPRGVDANKNPRIGSYFGRVYVGSSAAASTNSVNGTVITGVANYDFKGIGIYMLSPDLSTNLAPGGGTNVLAGGVFNLANASSPYRLTVGPDNNVYVASYATANATVYSFDATFSEATNVVLGPVGENQGFAAGTHGDPTEVFTTGSLVTSNLVVYTFDPDLPASQEAAVYYYDSNGNPVYHIGSEGRTTPGQFNNIFQYNIGAGPLPWTNGPDKGVCTGLPTFQDSQIGSVTVEPNGYEIAEFNRANYSDGDIQVYDTNFNILYTSLQPNGTDPFNTGSSSGYYAYAGVRVSPDGKYMMTVTIDNQIDICYLTNGIPDTSSMIKIVTSATTADSRGCAFDAADNILYDSNGQGLLRYYSLGYTSTCVTSNDITGTNGTFSFTVPSVQASLAISQPVASQNYGTPTPASFSIILNTNYLSAPVTINYSLTGTATNNVNYTVNLGTNSDGVIITSTSVTFPAGTYLEGGNWMVTILVTPTASPVSGPTLGLNIVLAGGQTYIPAEPLTGSLVIMNTGPQKLVLSAASAGTTMSRAVPNDYAEFIITRYGDLSVGGYTVTNITYGGTGVLGVDYTAGAQNLSTPPMDGAPGILVNAGVSAFTNIIGNPVARANLYEPPTNVTVSISLVNATTGTNNTSQEGVSYSVTTSTVTLTELDNAIGGEVVLWSDPLTNAVDSTNWTVTFASARLATNTVLPVVIPNYTNNQSTVNIGGTNDFVALFGNPIASDGVSPSPAMAANGWTSALKTSVENGYSSVAGLNVFPEGVKFHGNYALRFDMYLRLYDLAQENFYYQGVDDRQFALCGINNIGTNCDWRPTAVVTPGTGAGQGNGTTNWDGQFFAFDAGTDSQTPADFDCFSAAALPNAGGSDLVDSHGYSELGVFKSPPFDAVLDSRGFTGGEPVDQWVNVSVETTLSTNVSVYINHTPVFSSFINPGIYTNGTIMLGYEDPLPNLSDGSAYAYFSNVRVVELSPALTGQAANLIATNGQTVTFTVPASFASAPLTNTWYQTTAPVAPVYTNVVNATNMTGTLTLTNIQTGLNYQAVFSDAAGSITGHVASVEVIANPTNISAYFGDTVRFAVSASGPSAPTSYGWKHNGTNVAGNLHFAGTTTAALTITNVQFTDAGTYSVGVTNAYGSVTPVATLTISAAPAPAISSVSLSDTNVVVSFDTADTFVTSASFLLLSSPVVQGPYLTNTSAVITGSNGSFQIIVPKNSTNGAMFYQIDDY